MRAPPIAPNELSKEQRALHDDMKSLIASHLRGFQTETDQGALIGPWSVWLQDPTSGEPFWTFFKSITTQAKLPQSVREVAILKVGAHFKTAYHLYAHSSVAHNIGLADTQIEALVKNERPADLQPKNACAYSVTEALTRGGVLPEAVYSNATKLFGQDGFRELVYLIGTYCAVSVALNALDVKAPIVGAAAAVRKQGQVSQYKTLNPTTEAVEKVFPETTDEEVVAALNKAYHTYETDWRLRPVAERAKIVGKAASLLRQNLEEHAQLMTREMGKLISEARYEAGLTADILEYYATHGERFLTPKPLPEAAGSALVTEPIGVILAVEPWNFPYYQLVRVAAPQVVAGNVVMFKHAPTVPQCALAFAKLFQDAGAPEGVYTNLFCSISQINMLIDDFRVRGVTLTGSERAGASVAERAGRNLKKVVLELGGSDPLIVLPDADLENTLDQGVAGRMINMGQACVASKRFIVVGKERGKAFLNGMIKRMGILRPGDPADSKTTLAPLFAERQLTDLLNQIERAKAHGARIVLGGQRIDRRGWYLEPTIITDISKDNPLYQEETFGPLASFYVVDTEQEAIELANATSFGLGAAVFGGDVAHAQDVASKIESGMVFVNSAAYLRPELPFGGVKNSGFGRELGELGIEEFVNRKVIRTAT